MPVKPSLFAFSAAAFALAGTAHTAATCVDKEQAIQQQIIYAKMHGNTAQLAGLQKALNETQAHCTDQALHADLEKKVQQKQRKVAERQQDLAQAQGSGKPDKIAEQQRQLEEAQAELKEAQDALH